MKKWEFIPKNITIKDFVQNQKEGAEKTGDNLLKGQFYYKKIPIEDIVENEYNIREEMDDNELEEIADSILEIGQIQKIRVMDRGDGKYISLEGNRRIRAAKKRGGEKNITHLKALVGPMLSVDQQKKIMCDADIFERVSLKDTYEGIATEYYLEKEQNESLTIEEFSGGKREKWSKKLIEESILYSSLPIEVKQLYVEKLIDKATMIELARIENLDEQKSWAATTAILNHDKNQLTKEFEDHRYQNNFFEEDWERWRETGQQELLRKKLLNQISGVEKRLVSENDVLKNFQTFIKLLNGANDE